MNFSTPQDAYALMNSLVKQAQAVNAPTVVDLTTFVDAGSAVMSTGNENVLNSLSILIGKTIISSRPYKAKMGLIEARDGDMYSNRLRKITYYPRYNREAGFVNTNLHDDNIVNGRDTSTGVGDMWEINLPIVAETNFGGRYVWDRSDTTLLDQIKVAFRGPDEFNAFINGKMTELNNDIEQTKEAKNRIAILNHAAGIMNMVENGNLGKECAVNLTAEFNKEYGTKYTTDQILQEHIDDYLKWWAARVQLDSNKLTYRTEKYHYGLPKQVDGNTLNLLRHTPKDKQKFIYYNPMLVMAKARVLPEIFNPQYITEKNGEGVDYWQSFDDPQAIRVKPSIPVGESKEIVIPKLVGMLFDEDALITHYDLDSVYTTPIEARKCLYNTWYHYAQSTFDDFTENGIIYYMADDAEVSP